MLIRKKRDFFQAFCLTFLVLHSLAALGFVFVNELIGYFATLLISTVFYLGLIFTSDPFFDGPKPMSQGLLLINVWIGLLIFVLGPVQSRELVNYTSREAWLLPFCIGCLIASGLVIYLRAKPAKGERPSLFIPYESQKLTLIFVLLGVLSVMLHYNISYEAFEYGQSPKLNFEKNFLDHTRTIAFCLAINLISVLWQRAGTRGDATTGERVKGLKADGHLAKLVGYVRGLLGRVSRDSSSRLLIILGVLVIACVSFAAFTKVSGWRFFRSFSVPLNSLFIGLPLGAALLSKKGFHKSPMFLLRSIGTAVLALAAALYVDNGVGLTILFIFILLCGCIFFTRQLHNNEDNSKVSNSWSGSLRSGMLGLSSVVFFVLVPVIIFVVLYFDLGNKTIQERGFTMFYPAQTREADFVTQMFASLVVARDAVRFGGITGDGFWHNPLALPQLNSDMIISPTFFYFGLFGYCILLLIAGFITQVGRMIIRKDLERDEERALRFINFGFGALLVVAIPAVWLLGAMSLKLPLMGIVFPFLARGNYYQSCLGVLLAILVYLDRRSYDRESNRGASSSQNHSLAEWIREFRTERSAIKRMIRWTLLCLGVLALYYGASFAALVHGPVLAGQEGDTKYIVIPDNANQEYALDLRPHQASDGLQLDRAADEYRVGNTIVETEIPTSSEDRYSDPFVYISEYIFNRDEAYRGITIGKSGRLSPVLGLGIPFVKDRILSYVHKNNDVILFWEENIKERAHVTLRPDKDVVRLILGSDRPCDDKLPGAGVYLSESGKWRCVKKNELLKSESRLKVGTTEMRISLDSDPTRFLRIKLEPERQARASYLQSKQGEDFVLSRTRNNVIGGLQLAVKDIEASRLSHTPWASRFQNQFEKRATFLDRSGTELKQYDAKRHGSWYRDPNLFFTIGASQHIQAGLDYTFDPILSGKLGKDSFSSVLDTTIRSIRKEKILGQNVELSYDLDIQRALTQTIDGLLKGQDIQSGSAIILNGVNEVLATAQYSNAEEKQFRFQPGSGGFFLSFDGDFDQTWESLDDRPLEAISYANPLLRRPLCAAFKTDLVGSTIKGVLYTAALSDHTHMRNSHFSLAPSLKSSYILGFKDDDNNTQVTDGQRVFSATRELVPFGQYDFAPVWNYRKGDIGTNLFDAFRQSSNTASCYLAFRLNRANRLEFAFRRFMFENHLLLRSSAFENGLNPSRYLKAEVIRYADDFKWNDPSDVLRIGLGDKIYLSLLHLATFYSTVLINDGNFIHPTIVQRIGDGIRIPKQSYDLLDEEDRKSVIPRIKVLTESVLLNGTGKSFSEKLRGSGVEFVGGKTGTASLPVGDQREHKIFVACIKVKGKPFTIACRINYAVSGTNLAIELAARIVRNALAPQ